MEILCRNEVHFHEVHFVPRNADACCPFKPCEKPIKTLKTAFIWWNTRISNVRLRGKEKPKTSENLNPHRALYRDMRFCAAPHFRRNTAFFMKKQPAAQIRYLPRPDPGVVFCFQTRYTQREECRAIMSRNGFRAPHGWRTMSREMLCLKRIYGKEGLRYGSDQKELWLWLHASADEGRGRGYRGNEPHGGRVS